MQAITVKFIGPTNTRGSRYKASCQAGNITLASDHTLGPDANAVRAAVALCRQLGWTKPYYGDLLQGGLEDGRYVFIVTGLATRAYDIETGTEKTGR